MPRISTGVRVVAGALLSACSLAFSLAISADVSNAKKPVHLEFKEGMLNHVSITEVLKITMHFPQVENDEVRPSTRTTNYDFTERVEKTNPDGSALIGFTLDSVKTVIVLGEGRNREEFFKFNSNDADDINKKFHDIRTLPRAQFLGQTLRYTVSPDGQVKNFENLDQFHQMAMGKDYD